MKLIVEIAIGTAVAFVAYLIARPSERDTMPKPRGAESAAPPVSRPDGMIVDGRDRRDRRAVHGSVPIETATSAVEALEKSRSLQALQNAIIMASAEDMHSRSIDISDCLDGLELVGPQKLRFAVKVASEVTEATVEGWRFVEVVDGQPLPPSSQSCAEAVLGGGRHVVKAEDQAFPELVGEIEILYRVAAPAGPPP